MAVLGSVLKPPTSQSQTRYGYIDVVYAASSGGYIGANSYAYTGGSGLTRIIDITGQGIIEFCGWAVSTASSSWGFDFYIDGVELQSHDGVSAGGTMFCQVGLYANRQSGVSSATLSYEAIPFNESFQLDVTSNVNATGFQRHYLTS